MPRRTRAPCRERAQDISPRRICRTHGRTALPLPSTYTTASTATSSVGRRSQGTTPASCRTKSFRPASAVAAGGAALATNSQAHGVWRPCSAPKGDGVLSWLSPSDPYPSKSPAFSHSARVQSSRCPAQPRLAPPPARYGQPAPESGIIRRAVPRPSRPASTSAASTFLPVPVSVRRGSSPTSSTAGNALCR